ncbi:MAG: AAA family ATPase [Minisyncoccia bacterium]
MKKSILITGIAGSGKTTICHQLNKIGYKAYDIEATKGLFKTFYKDNSKFNKHNNDNLNEVKNREWICDIKKLKIFMKSQKKFLVFYCGMGTNIYDIFPLFDKVISLKVSSKILRNRLSGRVKGSYGRTKKIQNWLIDGKKRIEKKMKDNGAIFISSEGSLGQVINKIIKNV